MSAETRGERLTVLQCKFSAYLSWSQPFIHKLLAGVGDEVRNVVLCYRTENLTASRRKIWCGCEPATSPSRAWRRRQGTTSGIGTGPT